MYKYHYCLINKIPIHHQIKICKIIKKLNKTIKNYLFFIALLMSKIINKLKRIIPVLNSLLLLNT